MHAKLTSLLLVVFCLVSLAGHSQQCLKDENGVYKFKSDNIRLSVNNINSARVSVMWQSLMGEPIEDYKFYWERGYVMRNGEYAHHAFSEHPDLQARFEDLRPSFTLALHVKIGCSKSGNCSHSFEHIISSNDILVKRAGEIADFSVPSSYSWARFFGLDENSDAQKIESMRQAFVSGELIEIVEIKLYDIEWPQSLDFIWEELQNRRKRESKKEEDQQKSEEIIEDDEWATAEDLTEDNSENNSEDDTEWATDNIQTDNASESTSEWATEATQADDEWASSNSNSSTYSSAYIDIRDGKYGVVDTTSGQVLIPFKFDNISKFENGLATVLTFDHKDLAGCEGSGVSCSLNYYTEGIIDISGNFIVPPVQLLIISNEQSLFSVSSANPLLSESANRGIKEMDLECKKNGLKTLHEAEKRVKAKGGLVRRNN